MNFGFSIGYVVNCYFISEIRNYGGAVRFSEFMNKYISKEVDEGLLLGSFGGNFFLRFLMISFLNIVFKKDGIDRRVIADLSFFRGFAVNNGIFKISYLDVSVELTYSFVDIFVYNLKVVGRGVFMFKVDFKKVYR